MKGQLFTLLWLILAFVVGGFLFAISTNFLFGFGREMQGVIFLIGGIVGIILMFIKRGGSK